MADLLDRVDSLTHELLDINSKLEAELTKASRAAHRSKLLQRARLLKSFKTVVDQTRHLLWPCVLAAEQHAEQNVDVTLQAYRMERIKQMLTALRTEPDPSDSVKLFLAEVQRMIAKKEQ